jgi:hypothetical protein
MGVAKKDKKDSPKDNDQRTAVAPAETDGQLDAIREILLQQDRGRIGQLEEEIEASRQRAAGQIKSLQAQITARIDELETLQQEVARLEAKISAVPDDLMPKLITQMSGIISRTIHDSRDDLAEALGPIMGDAIRVQIRDSREGMVETLYPIILTTVQRAILEFAREFQRNVDARLKATFGPQGLLRSVLARLRGVSPSEIAFRNAFPFSVEELFLIQHESGLLLARSGQVEAQKGDSDLISGLLTAIRDFARDSFGESNTPQELDEIQYGDQRIIIHSGRHAYVAAVTKGVEPGWFRARLRKAVSELHIEFTEPLRAYDGDPDSLPAELPRMMADMAGELAAVPDATGGQTIKTRRRWIVGASLLSVLLLALACFYLQFTIALLPVAFGRAAEPTAVVQPVVLVITATPDAKPNPTDTPKASPTAEPSLEATATHVPTRESTTVLASSPTPRPTLQPTREPIVVAAVSVEPKAVTNAPVWVRDEPGIYHAARLIVPRDTEVSVLAQYGEWVRVEWSDGSEMLRGWLPLRWLEMDWTLPAERITPTPER